jgi:hypothetical protein
MSFVLGYVVNEGGILYINDVPHSSGRRLEGCLEWTLEEAEQARRIDYLSGVKELQLLLLLGTEVLETFNSFDSNATDNFDRYYRNGSGGWTRELLKLLYLKVSLIMDQVLLQQ